MNKRKYKKYCKKYKLKHYKMMKKYQQEIDRRLWWLRDIPQSSMFDIFPKVSSRGDCISFNYITRLRMEGYNGFI